MIKINKNIIPIDCDAHFKYICPNPKCSLQHWQSLAQVSVKNYKIVCDCGLIIKPKQVKSIDIIYVQDNILPETKNITNVNNEIKEIDEQLLNKTTQALVNYGFTKEEAISMINTAYLEKPTTDCATLVKQTLESFGTNHVNTNTPI